MSRTVKFAFNRWNDDERNVNVNRNDNKWNDNWWFAGRRYYLRFSLGFRLREFCLLSCPIQPPNILPRGLNPYALFARNTTKLWAGRTSRRRVGWLDI